MSASGGARGIVCSVETGTTCTDVMINPVDEGLPGAIWLAVNQLRYSPSVAD
jgi:hypothetical protein